jgi:tryptophan synthase alpha chain
MRMLDDCRVDCLELAVPFPDSVTDGEVNRRSAQRALEHRVGLDEVLDFLGGIRPSLRHLRVALLADWSHTVRALPLPDFAGRVAASGADGLLVHGLPPRLRTGLRRAAQDAGLPLVTTCYPNSAAEVKAEAAEHAGAYLYLVAHYGRSGGTPTADPRQLASTLALLREHTRAPIAVGFGIRSRADIARVHALGADAAIVGSAGVARIEHALAQQADVVAEFHTFVQTLLPDPSSLPAHASLPAPSSRLPDPVRSFTP